MEIDIKRIDAYRIVANESVRKFSRRLGISHTFYYNLLNGFTKDNVTLGAIEKIGRALKLDPKELIK